jgi:hypothetical protein
MEQTQVNSYEIAFSVSAYIATPCHKCGSKMNIVKLKKSSEQLTESRKIRCSNPDCDEKQWVVCRLTDQDNFQT